ncbi:MAG TPA: class I SAM-dependent RNA methyltransferase [Petrotogaceae bacterium]|nr:class I SAM-dependent RNA methyltransferase [Petrotogaceae bacterium]HQC39852.1 class I SAM-dependent RNA methyltransferase [Petrotogaceae bacterium]
MIDYIVLCAVGIEKVLCNEIKHLGYKIERTLPGKIYVKADEAFIYTANINLRTAERIMMVLKTFQAITFDSLYENIKSIRWSDYIPKNTNVEITKLSSVKSQLYALSSIQSVSHKAVYDSLKLSYNQTEHLSKDTQAVEIRLYLNNDIAEVCLDLSGEPLHKRGYRKLVSQAPLKETIASAMLLTSGWKRKFPLYDPFCGSGTIPIEAALYAMNIAPGLYRSFSVQNLKFYSQDQFIKAKQLAVSKIREYDASEFSICASDKDKEIISCAIKNADNFKLAQYITFMTESMEKLIDRSGIGYVVTNPPYGKRIRDEKYAAKVYEQMRYLKKVFKSWTYVIITDSDDFESYFDMKASKKLTIHNGSIVNTVYTFDNASEKSVIS